MNIEIKEIFAMYSVLASTYCLQWVLRAGYDRAKAINLCHKLSDNILDIEKELNSTLSSMKKEISNE